MRFSVIIPVYNKADTIIETIESVEKQTYRDFEIVVVNDGSTDDLLNALEHKKNITLISQPNQGVSVARNTGILAAKGEYICFLDADDLFENNHLQVLSELIDKYRDIEYFCTSHNEKIGDKTYCSNMYLEEYPADFILENLFEMLNKKSDSIIHTNSICVGRKLLIEEDLYFKPGERIGEDTDMWYRIALRTPIVISKKATTIYQRIYSTATKETTNTLEWCFEKRKDTLLSAEDISEEKKKEIEVLFDRYYMTCIRTCGTSNQRKKGLKIAKKVKNKSLKYYISLTYLFVPKFFCELIDKTIKNRRKSF